MASIYAVKNQFVCWEIFDQRNCCEITKTKNWKKTEKKTGKTEKIEKLVNWEKIDLCTLLWNSVNMKYMNILIVIFALINAQEGKLMDSCLVFLNGKTRTWNINLRDNSTLSPPISLCPLQCLSSIQFIRSS